jgi:hypothetical protein
MGPRRINKPFGGADERFSPGIGHRTRVFCGTPFISPVQSAAGILDRPWATYRRTLVLYAILCYNDEDAVWSWTKEEDDAVMGRLAVVRERLAPIMGPSARLLPTTAATTLRKSPEPIVIDGPYAETKEQLLGFYVIDVANLDAALDVARQLTAANPGGAYEIRPIALYQPDKRVS